MGKGIILRSYVHSQSLRNCYFIYDCNCLHWSCINLFVLPSRSTDSQNGINRSDRMIGWNHCMETKGLPFTLTFECSSSSNDKNYGLPCPIHNDHNTKHYVIGGIKLNCIHCLSQRKSIMLFADVYNLNLSII